MIKRITIVATLFLFSCGGEEVYVLPQGILEKEEIIPIIVDLQVLESHFQRNFARTDLYRDALDSSSVSVFENHGTSKQTYTESLIYYAEMPDTLFSIYEAALDTVNFRLNMIK